jgi:hypothetical protein
VTFWKQLSRVLPPLPEMKIPQYAFANRFAAFKHKLAPAAGKMGTIICPTREPVKGCRRKRFLTNCGRWQAIPAKVVHIFTQFTKP